jgi:hypothetical protein
MQIIKITILVLFITFMSSVHAKQENIQSYQVVIESGTGNILNALSNNAKSQKISQKPLGEIIQWTGLQLLNSPYVSYLLDKSTPEYLYISLSNTDCMLFIEEVLVISNLIKENRLTIVNYIDGIKKLRYHGDIKYCNRNHYFKDWAVMNNQVVYDVAFSLTAESLPYKTHVLGDSIANGKNNNYSSLDCIRQREKLIDKETMGFIPLSSLPKYIQYIQAGDIIGIVRSGKKADSIHHLGIAYIHDGKVGMINASSITKKVIIADTLTGYLSKFKDTEGIILLRAK